ncbi:hypothetical protein D3C74_160070 [compost metagenome]
MSKYHFRKLQNEINNDRQHRIKRLAHRLNFGNITNDERKEVKQVLLTIGGGVL